MAKKNSRPIKVYETTLRQINSFREHPRETWDDLIRKVLKKLKGLTKSNGKDLRNTKSK